ncbi:hypothetical protein MRX96_037228 [Rhipicephalus microplus]
MSSVMTNAGPRPPCSRCVQGGDNATREPVRLQPLHFLRSVAAGDNVQTMCAVQSGDEVDFSWRKDGQPLSAIGHRLVIHSLPTTSILLIKNATVFDAGNYTCVGRNALGHDSVTAQLRVEGQPHWLKEPPKEVVVGLGDVATLRCDVIGFPHARVTWFRIDEDSVEVPPGPRWQGSSDSSIELSSVSRQDVGTYRCRADNGLGQVSADIQLVVRGQVSSILHDTPLTTQPSLPPIIPLLHEHLNVLRSQAWTPGKACDAIQPLWAWSASCPGTSLFRKTLLQGYWMTVDCPVTTGYTSSTNYVNRLGRSKHRTRVHRALME